MTNVNKLRGKMVESGVTVKMLAERLGISRSSLYRKLKGDGGTLFIREANLIVEALSLTPDEATAIFFN